MTRTLIGVDLPSFIAARIMPPASKANSRSANRGSVASPSRSAAPTAAPNAPLVGELDLDHGIHWPGVRGVGRRQVGQSTPISEMTAARSSWSIASLTYASTCAILFSVTSIRVPLGALA